MPVAAPHMQEKLGRVKLVLLFIFVLNLAFWAGSRDIYSRWAGVPPAPSAAGASAMTLGDGELSYRTLAMTLQSLGDLGVDETPLKDYNYAELGKWFVLLSKLDAVSDHVPMLAAYYFGSTRVPKDIAVIVDYLSAVGAVPVGEKWRWLAHAAYLAQYRLYDFDLALKLAYKLQKMPNSDTFPQWARQMPAFVLAKKGDRAAARALAERMLLTQDLPPNEINTLKGLLVDKLGVSPQDIEQILRQRAGGP